MIHQVRIYSGLVLLVFVIGHLGNHALGIISLDVMEAGRPFTILPWRTLPGTVIFVTAVLLHAGVGLYSLYLRRNLKLKKWEAWQLVLGLLIPLLLTSHLIGTRGMVEFFDVKHSYTLELAALWVVMPEFGVFQALVLVLVWMHACIGMHTWLRLKSGYADVKVYLFSFTLLLPVLALAGYTATGVRVVELAKSQAWMDKVIADSGFKFEYVDFTFDNTYIASGVWAVMIAFVFLARKIRSARTKKASRSQKIYYKNFRESRVVDLHPGATLLESLRVDGISHASVCGGRGRCTTCRVKIGDGADQLTPASATERKALERISAPENVRLACQIHPTISLEVTPLLPPTASASDGAGKLGYEQGEEVQVVILFADLRESTKLAENRMPFDVVFILNQFFAEMSASLEDTGGHYAQFNGDGLMALYGLETSYSEACIQALQGAQHMLKRLDILNQRLAMDLQQPMRMGIGIHSGDAIVGKMGPPSTPIISALGDNVNIAARLEAQTKELGAEIVVSVETVSQTSVDLSGFKTHNVAIRGREQGIEVYAVENPRGINLNTHI